MNYPTRMPHVQLWAHLFVFFHPTLNLLFLKDAIFLFFIPNLDIGEGLSVKVLHHLRQKKSCLGY